MSLLILFSLAIGITVGAMLMRRGTSGWIIAALLFVALIAGFAGFAATIDPYRTDIRGIPLLNRSSLLALCWLLFSLAFGVGALMAAIVGQMTKLNSKGRNL